MFSPGIDCKWAETNLTNQPIVEIKLGVKAISDNLELLTRASMPNPTKQQVTAMSAQIFVKYT